MRRWMWLGVALATGCAPDTDGDGFSADVDCDDAEATVFPGAAERCDGVDQDCDGEVDVGAVDARVAWVDGDGDGHGDPGAPVFVCDVGLGLAEASGDCDDADPAVFPGATPTFEDRDGDGWGNDAAPIEVCGEPIGTSRVGGDCDDHRDAVNPDAVERCDGVDDDCDLSVDEDAADAVPWFADGDGDGFGAGTPTFACEAPPSTSGTAGDCDDGRAAAFPGADEWCDGADDDCDGVADDGARDLVRYHPDLDGDGFGGPAGWVEACSPPDATWLTDDRDCDDWDAASHPGAAERCDGDDNDCDGLVDGPGAVDRTMWYRDLDSDGFGVSASGVLACDAPVDHVAMGWDCDDANGDTFPLGTEDCADGLDNDCSGAADDCGGGGTPVAVYPETSADASLVAWGAPLDRFGAALATPDVDGDGVADVVVGGIPPGGSDSGNLWVYVGPPTSGEVTAATTEHWGGPGTSDGFGNVVASLGDLDGDGYDELGASATSWQNGGGAVWLRYGTAARTPGSASAATWDAWLQTVGNDLWLGHGLTGLGDVDGDGYDDAAYGYSGYGANNQGAVHLLFGGPTRRSGEIDENTLPGFQGDADAYLCRSDCLTSADLDGDGLQDVVASAYVGPGSRSYVSYGDPVRPVGLALPGTLAVLEAVDADGGSYGQESLAPGDVDGDGYADLAIADLSYDLLAPSAGSVWLFRGSPTRLSGSTPLTQNSWVQVLGNDPGAGFGMSLAALGDVDADGADDLAIGSYYGDGEVVDSGIVLFYWGLTGGLLGQDDASHVLSGTVGGGGFGKELAFADVDGSGGGDLLVATGDYGFDGRLFLFVDPFGP